MGNLENILKNKEENLKKVEDAKTQKIEKTEKKYNKQINILKKNKEKDIEKIRENSLLESKQIEEIYVNEATKALTQDLENDYAVLQKRCEYKGISQESIEEAAKLKKSLSKIKDEEDRNTLVKYLKGDVKKLIEDPEIEELKEQKTIHSYITNNGERCYILTPIKNRKQNFLMDNLSNKLLGVISLEKITVGRGQELRFEAKELEFPKEFVMLELSSTEDTKYLAKELLKKLNDSHIQPKEFKENNLTHEVIYLDHKIFKNFLEAKGLEKEVPMKVTKKKEIKISPEYEDRDTVISIYNKLNEEYKKIHGEDLYIGKIPNLKINGKSGYNFYYSLVGHLRQGTIKPEEISSKSNLEKYVRKDKEK